MSPEPTNALYACIHASDFPAQALLRLRPDLEGQAVAVLEGRAPKESVCAMNRQALRTGASLGMTRLDAEAISELRILARSTESEAAARAVLLECLARFSPRIEEASQGTECAFVLDITGTERLFGHPAQLAERMRSALAAAGFRVSIAVSANFDTSRIKAAASRGISVIAGGEEACALAKLPLDSLGLADEHRETFATWGIRTLGQLAALPEAELITRLGAESSSWRERARGVYPHMFQPMEPEFSLKEFCEFETPVEQMDSLLFIGARMIDCLVARASDRALALALLTASMKLEGGGVHRCILRPAIASVDRKFLLKLLQLEIAAHPPQAAVVSFELASEAGHTSTMQLGLFAPQTPEPSRLDVTLARLRAMVGDDRVGSPVLEDKHRPGTFRMEGFGLQIKSSASHTQTPRMALRRVRPPLPVWVALHAARPVVFRDRESRYEITAAYGPWKASGCWWSTDEWNVEEWDVLAVRSDETTIACLLVFDMAHNEWRLEAFFD